MVTTNTTKQQMTTTRIMSKKNDDGGTDMTTITTTTTSSSFITTASSNSSNSNSSGGGSNMGGVGLTVRWIIFISCMVTLIRLPLLGHKDNLWMMMEVDSAVSPLLYSVGGGNGGGGGRGSGGSVGSVVGTTGSSAVPGGGIRGGGKGEGVTPSSLTSRSRSLVKEDTKEGATTNTVAHAAAAEVASTSTSTIAATPATPPAASATTTTATPPTKPTTTTSTSPSKKACITMLLSNTTGDVRRAMYALKTLHVNMNHNIETTPAILFNEGNLSDEQKQMLQNVTNRPVIFDDVSDIFTVFPEGFNPSNETTNFKKRSKWGYQHMCRFWSSKVFTRPILDNFDTYMRMDVDSCFFDNLTTPKPYFPGFPKYELTPKGKSETEVPANYVYGKNRMTPEDPKYMDGLFNVSKKYVELHNITIQNVDLWKAAERGMNLYTNLEIVDIQFFRKPEVQHFMNYITDDPKAEYGVYRKRWGDAPIRLVTVAIFVPPAQVLNNIQHYTGYLHPCFEGKHPRIDKMYNDFMNSTTTTATSTS